jgi:hypothetical protein
MRVWEALMLGQAFGEGPSVLGDLDYVSFDDCATKPPREYVANEVRHLMVLIDFDLTG